MKTLYSYIIDEGLKDTVRNLISKFKRTQKEDQSKNAKSMEDARKTYQKMIKNEPFASTVAKLSIYPVSHCVAPYVSVCNPKTL